MPDNNAARPRRSPSPKAGSSVQPPLSKYYYGPAQGWASTEVSPSHNGSSWNLNALPDQTLNLASRQSPGPPPYSPASWARNYPSQSEPVQGWQHHLGSPTGLAEDQFIDSYALMHGGRNSTVNPTWESNSPRASMDLASWATNGQRLKYVQSPETPAKPPLPPRTTANAHQNQAHPPPSAQDKRLAHNSAQSAYSSKPPSSRVSATTIDVPLFLQPLPSEQGFPPPLPQRPSASFTSEHNEPSTSPTQPHRIPPPPPKIPLDEVSGSVITQSTGQIPRFDPQHSIDASQVPTGRRPVQRRPTYDPQDSHGPSISTDQRQTKNQFPVIPSPRFSRFDAISALATSSLTSGPVDQARLPEPSQHRQQGEDGRKQNDPRGLGSNVLSVENDRAGSSLGGPEGNAEHTPSPEPQLSAVAGRDGSISTTDVSSNRAGLSTPESQHTSNTSYRENDAQGEHGRSDQYADDSFYWHSGRSSSDAEEQRSQSGSTTATPGRSSVDHRSTIVTTSSSIPTEPQHPARSTSLSPSATLVPYGASALGFGGPSDWEYFGDYEAEEIDDEDLYTRPKPSELPSDVTSTDNLVSNKEGVQSEKNEPSRKSSLAPVLNSDESSNSDPRSPKTEDDDKAASKTSVDESLNPNSQTTFAHHPTRLNNSWNTEQRPSSYDQRPDLDDVIRAWSQAPFVGVRPRRDTSSPTTSKDRESVDPIAEASLASTPQERMLGIDLILKDAPEMPKLPDAIDQSSPSFDRVKFDRKRASELSSPWSSEPSQADPKSPQRRSHYIPLETGRSDGDSFVMKRDLQPENQNTADDSQQEHNLQTEAEPQIENDDLGALGQQHSVQNDVVVDQEVVASSLPVSEPMADSDNKDGMLVGAQVAQADSESQTQHQSEDQAQSRIIGKVSRRASNIESSPPSLISQNKSSSASLRHSPQPSISQDPAPTATPEADDESAQTSVEPTQKPGLPSEASQPVEAILQRSLTENQPTSIAAEKLTAGDSERANIMETVKNEEPSSSSTASLDGPVSTKERDLSEELQTSQEPTTQQTHAIDSNPKDAVLPEAEKAVDPYSDLDPWGKASLNRFAAMLREEARAESNKDKLNIFNVFASRESRLRVVLYGTDDELILPQKEQEPKQEESKSVDPSKGKKSGFVRQAVERANTISLERSNTISLERSLKALPALPKNRDSVVVPTKKLTPLVTKEIQKKKPVTGIPGEELEQDDKHTADSTKDDMQYSPGGRPIFSNLPRSKPTTTQNDTTGTAEGEDVAEKRPGIAETPTVPSEDAQVRPRPRPPPVPEDGQSEVNNYLINRRSIYRPYATQTLETLENGSNFDRQPDLNIDPPTVPVPIPVPVPARVPTVTAPSSKFNPAVQAKASEDTTGTTLQDKARPIAPTQPDMRRFVQADFDPLTTILPEGEATLCDSNRMQDLKDVMEAIPEDFSFIHNAVVAWDAKARKQRAENDQHRHERQVESERRIDSLFDDHEIGYGDIAELEGEFKRSEASRKADEDRAEYQTFVQDVFTLVWTRMHYELDQLTPHYERYSTIMDKTVAGKDMFTGSEDCLALAPTMTQFLALHQKVEIRHQKAFEAVLQRDHRLKKTEVSPWYTLGNIAKVRQLEKQFEEAEKKAIIEYCQQRDVRANRLMDVLDQNTLRGVGANQDYMEAIMKAVRRIASGRAYASMPGENQPSAGLEEVQKARTVTALLATSSEQIVQTFHVADMLLNSADYEVSVAKAKVAKVDNATLAKLKEEKAKEDQKLMRDLEHRLALIREDSRRTNDEIIKLMLFLGVQNGRATETAPRGHGVHTRGGSLEVEGRVEQASSSSSPPLPPLPPPGHSEHVSDPAHEERLRKALEEAKRRKALKDASG